MDTFMDKLSQRFNAQEIIKANSAADAAKLEQLQFQVEQYNVCLQEMRKLQQKNSEMNNWMKGDLTKAAERLDSSVKKIEEGAGKNFLSVEELQEKLGDVQEQLQSLLEKPESLNKEMMENLFRQSDEFNHKEDVKVYRNVQAAIVEENAKQLEKLTGLLKDQLSEQFTDYRKKTAGKITAALVFSILAFLAFLGTCALQVMQWLNIKLF